MTADTTYFLTAGSIATVVALQLTLFWRQNRNIKGIGYWTAAAWMFALADLGFLLSAASSAPEVRQAARIMVTATYGTLLLGARSTAGLRPGAAYVLAVIAIYGVGLAWLANVPGSGPWRVVLSRSIWGTFCILSFMSLRGMKNHYSTALLSPAAIFLLQAIYLFARVIAYVFVAVFSDQGEPAYLVYFDYAGSVMFDAALFVALLLAFIADRNVEIAASRVELTTLSGLLPICSWCKKMRDDAGYWHEVTEYLTTRNLGKVTHGICQPCAEKLAAGDEPPPPEKT